MIVRACSPRSSSATLPFRSSKELRLIPQRFTDLESGVRAIYTAVFDTVADDTAVLQALFAEVLAKPNGIGMQFFRERILPRITSTVGAWLKEQITRGPAAPICRSRC